jgi:fimbrial chaperone protein
MLRFIALLVAFLIVGAVGSTDASSLRVAPVGLELDAATKVATMRLRNDGTAPVDVQIRVFAWTQADGVDRLSPTRDVVVSPPATTVSPGVEYVIRVVRIAKRPVELEEAYRIVVDEIPDLRRRRSRTVAFALRQSIPLFFAPATVDFVPQVPWQARHANGRVSVTAINRGGRFLKIANLRLLDRRGGSHLLSRGLVGYVLAGSSMTWTFPGPAEMSTTGGSLALRFESQDGPVDADAPLRPGG